MGQNIWYYSESPAVDKGVCAWYNGEAGNYVNSYGKSDPGLSLELFGHFTQVVWKDSTHVGCGSAKCDNLGYYMTVCNYSPPGNVRGAYGDNVNRPLGRPTVTA